MQEKSTYQVGVAFCFLSGFFLFCQQIGDKHHSRIQILPYRMRPWYVILEYGLIGKRIEDQVTIFRFLVSIIWESSSR